MKKEEEKRRLYFEFQVWKGGGDYFGIVNENLGMDFKHYIISGNKLDYVTLGLCCTTDLVKPDTRLVLLTEQVRSKRITIRYSPVEYVLSPRPKVMVNVNSLLLKNTSTEFTHYRGKNLGIINPPQSCCYAYNKTDVQLLTNIASDILNSDRIEIPWNNTFKL